MAKEKQSAWSDEEILPKVEEKVRRGVGWYDSKLSKERERVISYYNLTLPKKQSEGRASYTSSDVYDAVESMKSQLLETFAGNPESLVTFPALHVEDSKAADDATCYANHQIFKENNGYDVFSHVIHDGLTARVGVVKVFWEKIEEEIEEEHSGSYSDIHALAAGDDIKSMESEADETQPPGPDGFPMFKGKHTRVIDRSKVTLCPVPPEEFIIEFRAYTIPQSGMVSHRTLKNKDDLIKEGYDPKKVKAINWDDARALDLTQEQLSRNQPINDGMAPLDDTIQPEQQKVMLYETYIKLDIHDGQGVKLWKIVHAGHIMLEKQVVDRAPFLSFCPLPVPHIFHGNNFGARVIPYQNARTVLTRAILDHATVTTNPRWGVVKGGLLNPKELLDNRLGGIVNMRSQDAVKPLEQQGLNPFVFQTLEALKANKEESTGISALSQGLNKDAISNQNSQGLVQDLVTLSQGRQKIIARNFAYNFLVPLYLEVYRLVLENEKQEKIIEVCGDFRRIDTADWIERTKVKVAFHLGYGEQDRQVQKYQALYKELSSDPGLAPMFRLENRYALIMDAMKADGSFANAPMYLTPPNKVPPPQPDPLKVQELQIKDKSATAALTTAQATALKNEKQAAVSAMKETLGQLKLQLEALQDDREQNRQDADVKNRIDISQREMKLLEEHPPNEDKGIVAPRG